jgi:hypothetical protein
MNALMHHKWKKGLSCPRQHDYKPLREVPLSTAPLSRTHLYKQHSSSFHHTNTTTSNITDGVLSLHYLASYHFISRVSTTLIYLALSNSRNSLHLTPLSIWFDLPTSRGSSSHEFSTWPSREVARQPPRALCVLARDQTLSVRVIAGN